MTVNTEHHEIDETEDLEDVAAPVVNRDRVKSLSEGAKKRPTAFDKLRRDLSDEELNQTGVQKLLLFQIEELGERVRDLEPFRIRSYNTAKHLAVAESRIQAATWANVLEGACLTFGGALLGFSKDTDPKGDISWDLAILAIGALLIVFVAVARFISHQSSKEQSRRLEEG